MLHERAPLGLLGLLLVTQLCWASAAAARDDDTFTLEERAWRPAVEFFSGALAGGVGMIGFAFAGGGLCDATGWGVVEDDGCIGPVIVGAAVGALFAVPFGVYLAGEGAGGDGSLGWTLAVPWLSSALAVIVGVAADAPALVLAAPVFTFAGSMIAYEVSSESNIADARKRRVGPYLTPFSDGKGAGLRLVTTF